MSGSAEVTVRRVMVAGEQHLIFSVPLHIKRRRGRKEIIVPGGIRPQDEPRTNETLALTIARAHRWRDLLDEGRFHSVSELAREVGLSHVYVGRLLRLTLLAPDIIEAVLAGTEPSGLSIATLASLPLDWESQRVRLGMPSSHS